MNPILLSDFEQFSWLMEEQKTAIMYCAAWFQTSELQSSFRDSKECGVVFQQVKKQPIRTLWAALRMGTIPSCAEKKGHRNTCLHLQVSTAAAVRVESTCPPSGLRPCRLQFYVLRHVHCHYIKSNDDVKYYFWPTQFKAHLNKVIVLHIDNKLFLFFSWQLEKLQLQLECYCNELWANTSVRSVCSSPPVDWIICGLWQPVAFADFPQMRTHSLRVCKGDEVRTFGFTLNFRSCRLREFGMFTTGWTITEQLLLVVNLQPARQKVNEFCELSSKPVGQGASHLKIFSF